jgi:hypothetical protein
MIFAEAALKKMLIVPLVTTAWCILRSEMEFMASGYRR